MNYEDWSEFYLRICAEFRYDPSMDAKAADLLSTLLKGCRIFDYRNIAGRMCLITGPKLDPERDDHPGSYDWTVVADSALPAYYSTYGRPGIIFTDLDGDVDLIKRCNREGTVCVIHAHGDNMDKIREHVPDFRSNVIGTCQSAPFGNLLNFGGFTDGDRAAFFMDTLGFDTIDLIGFDFETPVLKKGQDPEQKRKKLLWARELLRYLSEKRGVDFREGYRIRI
ncbi:MAG: 6-hydroxymethylpterin diphosphokinase MptE-like protein [Thermoplasmataceae archaeon]